VRYQSSGNLGLKVIIELAKVQCTKKKEIIPESYTFLKTAVKMDRDKKITSNQTSNKISGIEKNVKPRTIDSNKTKNRHNTMVGGHNKQGHSSVYE
jgi:hypothetical protein